MSRNGSERVALVFEETEYTYAQLDALANGLAAELARRGTRAGDRVALMSSNRPEWVVAVQAIWRLGAAVVLFSPAWKQAETEHALAITKPAAAVGDHPVLARLMPMLHLDDPITQAPATPAPAPAADAEAVLVFSSGTTGLPKAVRHTHGSLRAAIGHWRDALELTERDRIQVTTPPSHILGLLNITTALELGIWMRLHRRFDLDRMLHHIEADKITVEMAVAPIALALASHPKLEDYDLSSLRFIMWGATPVTPSIAQTVTRRSGAGWVPAYGASELPVITCNPVREARLDSAGKPVPGVSLRVVSLATGAPVMAGEIGEIQVRSESLMSGYLPAEATAESFSDGWYRCRHVRRPARRGSRRARARLRLRQGAHAVRQVDRFLPGGLPPAGGRPRAHRGFGQHPALRRVGGGRAHAARGDPRRHVREGVLRARRPNRLRDGHPGTRRHRQHLGLPGPRLPAARHRRQQPVSRAAGGDRQWTIVTPRRRPPSAKI
jgi:long-chain acyl-CoA synthetase